MYTQICPACPHPHSTIRHQSLFSNVYIKSPNPKTTTTLAQNPINWKPRPPKPNLRPQNLNSQTTNEQKMRKKILRITLGKNIASGNIHQHGSCVLFLHEVTNQNITYSFIWWRLSLHTADIADRVQSSSMQCNNQIWVYLTILF